MLIAYAVENLCKAILIHRKQNQLRCRLLTRVPKDIQGHDLLQIANEIKLSLSIPEQNLLARLSRNSIWAARYPIPLESVKMSATEKLLDGQNSFVAYFMREDIEMVNSFLERLRKVIKDELKIEVEE